MGRWESETVSRYTRDAALFAPTELASLVMLLSGLARPADPPPAATEPEPEAPAPQDWVFNPRTDCYHLASSVDGKARCGWRYSETGMRGQVPPPWHLVTCKQCVPELRKRLKAHAKAAAAIVRAHPDSVDE